MNIIEENICTAYYNWTGKKTENITLLPASGSSRLYFRVSEGLVNIIGAYNDNVLENNAFIGFTEHFRKQGLAVPEIYCYLPDKHIYLMQDLGDITLFNYLSRLKEKDDSVDQILVLYKNVIDHLVRFQLYGGAGLDYSLSYPRMAFDQQSVLWDLNYFKYYFLKLAGISFNEQKLENDFLTFASLLMEADSSWFLYRDFQSRNIMLQGNEIYFIDYQGGRKGALQYDLASLLYDAKADIPVKAREILLGYYLERISAEIQLDKQEFLKYYYSYVLIRILQAMGSYGYRGYFERKLHFLASIPYAIKNLSFLLENHFPDSPMPELKRILVSLTESDKLLSLGYTPSDKLKLTINSFAYKNGIPEDHSGHGGGFVFDCRFLHNPGREEEFRKLTGNDKAVVAYLESQYEVNNFFNEIAGIMDMAVRNYLERGFTHLMVSFGCTGGQHRSVYMANKLAGYIQQKFDVEVNLNHRELPV